MKVKVKLKLKLKLKLKKPNITKEKNQKLLKKKVSTRTTPQK